MCKILLINEKNLAVDSGGLTQTYTPLDPQIFHTANLLFHLANVLLVFLLIRRLMRNDLAALIGSFVFAIHPLQVESIAWISELRGLFAAFLTFSSIHLYLNHVGNEESGRKVQSWLYYCASLLIAVLAMLSKPSADTIGLFIVGAAWLCHYKNNYTSVIEALPFLAAGSVLILVTNHVQNPPLGQVFAWWLRPVIAP